VKLTRKIIEIDDELCDGCGQCVPSCAEGAIRIIDGKARLINEKYCDGLGACLGECPTGALSVVEGVAEGFDAKAVEEHLNAIAQKTHAQQTTLPCGCPSAHVQTFVPPVSAPGAKAANSPKRAVSALSHWPVQIGLVPPTAAFLKGAHLLVAADCVPVAYPNFHQDFLKGKIVMVGCPKFDDVQGYCEKFVEIFGASEIRSITVPIMEVPCCSGLPMVLKHAMEEAGKEIPMEQVVISAKGEVLKKERLVAVPWLVDI
jgi:NAD-dependent dihydropyrimidine dehydrogenase PreA subunit